MLSKKLYSKVGINYCLVPILGFVISIILYIIFICLVDVSNTYLTSQIFGVGVSSIITLIILYHVIYKKNKNIMIYGKLKSKKIISMCFNIYCMCYFISFTLGILGKVITKIFDMEMSSLPVSQKDVSTLLLEFGLIVIMAPIIEEVMYRKFLIQILWRLGEKKAIFVSAFMFAITHGAISTMLVTFVLGGFAGIVFVKTGKVKYCIYIHMFHNFISYNIGLISDYMNANLPQVTSLDEVVCLFETNAFHGLILVSTYILVYFFVIFGMIQWILMIKTSTIIKDKGIGKLVNILKECFGNVGMILYILFNLVFFLL